VKILHRKADLPQIVGALPSTARLPCRLHRWQQQGDKQGDDRHHDQQFDQRETRSQAALCGSASGPPSSYKQRMRHG
jgi:hypothetical protein